MDNQERREGFLRESISFERAVKLLRAEVRKSSGTEVGHSCVGAIVLLCAARMESLANYVLQEGTKFFQSLGAILERRSVSEKAEVIAELVFDRSLEHGKEPYQSFQDFLALRNELVHPKPTKEPVGCTMDELKRGKLSSKFAARWKLRCEMVRGSRGPRCATTQIESILTPECAEWAIALVPVCRDILQFGVTKWNYKPPAQFHAAMPAEFSYDEARKTYLGKLHKIDTRNAELFPEHHSRDRGQK